VAVVLVVMEATMVLMVDLVGEVQVLVVVVMVELLQEIKQIILEQEQQQDMEIMVGEDIITLAIL
tara:strand:+ start:117 stop:311 length:195 start_codon:yes stop_codon:yes gene_type:complete